MHNYAYTSSSFPASQSSKCNKQSEEACMGTRLHRIINFLVQLSGDDTFENVCPLLDLMEERNTNYTQHVRVATDLQLTTRNLPDVVRVYLPTY